MSTELLHESLSAVLDNEADDLEVRRALSAMAQDEAMRARWKRYQIARSAMHRELLDPQLDLAARVSAQLAQEPVAQGVAESATAGGHSGFGQRFGRFAVAASVMLAVLVGVRFYNHTQTVTAGALAVSPSPASHTLSVPAPASVTQDRTKVELQTVSETYNRSSEGRVEPKVQQVVQPASFNSESGSTVSATRANP